MTGGRPPVSNTTDYPTSGRLASSAATTAATVVRKIDDDAIVGSWFTGIQSGAAHLRRVLTRILTRIVSCILRRPRNRKRARRQMTRILFYRHLFTRRLRTQHPLAFGLAPIDRTHMALEGGRRAEGGGEING